MNDALQLFLTFAMSLGLTLLIEVLVAHVWRLRGRELLLVLLVNVLTNPAAVYLNLLFEGVFPGANVFLWQLPLEACVVLAEGLSYRFLTERTRHPWLLSVVANGFSYGIGLLLNLVL